MIEIETNIEFPSEYAELVGRRYSATTTDKHKKDNGQFLTSKVIAKFISDLAEPKSDSISILDPGCGTGILCCSLIENLVAKRQIANIDLTVYETDPNIIESTNKVLIFLKNWLSQKNIKIDIKVEQSDFILSNAEAFSHRSLFETLDVPKYDYIISNPPYFKISKSDPRALAAAELVYGQPNIYSLFMGLSAKLLTSDGELIFITPRSFAAGNYFRAFRTSFFQDVSISNIHIFESRNKMFRDDNVLQENIIIRATKQDNPTIKISTSYSGVDITDCYARVYKTNEILDRSSNNKILFIPSNPDEDQTIKIFKQWTNSLIDYNIQISTGPVVAFRHKDYLISDYDENLQLAPLIWLHNVKKMEFIFPLKKGSKASYIIDSPDTRKVLLKNKNYILIRRFSAKDDISRLVCSPYFSSNTAFDKIAVENHVNYIYRPNGDLSVEEIWGVSALFNSRLFDTYFRTFNGNTQVGASELKQIKMPPLNTIKRIGKEVKNTNHKASDAIDTVINDILLGELYVKAQ